jgi:hypothetical protein
MRHSSLCLTVVFLFSAFTLAQHSSGSSGSSSSSSGGGSHSSSSGGGSASSSSNSGGSHSSSASHSSGVSSASHGTASHTSSSHSSSTRGTNSAVHAENGFLTSKTNPSNRELREPSENRIAQPEKRGFFSHLRHPFRKPEAKPVADLRRPVCFKGPCPVCPKGQKGCGVVVNRNNGQFCSQTQIWSGGACVANTHFLGDCNGFHTAILQQEQRMQAAEAIRDTACSTGPPEECFSATAASQSEASLRRALETRYQRCLMQTRGSFRYAGSLSGSGVDHWFDPFSFELSY